jgi:hypothetical protein
LLRRCAGFLQASKAHSAGARRFRHLRQALPRLGFDDDVAPLANAFGGPETVIVSQRDMDGCRTENAARPAAFLDSPAPTVEIQLPR